MLPMLLARTLAPRVSCSISSIYRGSILRASLFSHSAPLHRVKAEKQTTSKAVPTPQPTSPALKTKVSSKATGKKAAVASRKNKAVKAKAPTTRRRTTTRPIAVASKTKLYPPRPKRSTTGFSLFCKPGMKESGTMAAGSAHLITKSAEWRAMADEEKQVLNDQAAAIRVDLSKASQAWFANLSPAALRQYRADSRAKTKRRTPVDDHGNAVKRAGSVFSWFMKSRAAEVYKETGNIGDMSRAISKEWKALSTEGKAPYKEIRDQKAAAYHQAKLVAHEKHKQSRLFKAAA